VARRGWWPVLAIAAVLFALVASPALAQGRHVVFDLSHLEGRNSNPFEYQSPSGWGPAMDLLVSAGYTWSVIPEGGRLTPQALEGAAFLIVAEPETAFAPDEVTAVLDFVKFGGGLLLATDAGAAINDLAGPLEVTFLLGAKSPFTAVTDIVQGHPLTVGVNEIDWPAGTALDVGTAATPLAFYENAPVLAAQEYFSGRIVYVGDNELFSNYGINDPNNTPLFLNIAGWLSPADGDADGITNDLDLCPATPAGQRVDVNGCSYPERQAEACPVDGVYKNHGTYVCCVSHAANQAVADGLITKQEKSAAVSDAARSDIGKKQPKPDPKKKCKKHGKKDCKKKH